MNDKPNYPPIRRVVTGHDAGSVAKVIIDTPATNAKYPSAGLVSTLMWSTTETPPTWRSARHRGHGRAHARAPPPPTPDCALRSSI